MKDPGHWIEEFPAAITVTDAAGTIIAMNARSRETFASDGGAELIGRSLFDCHPEPARSKLRDLYERRSSNSYTIEKDGRRKMIHQVPWFQKERFSGLVEIAIEIPAALPHFRRD